jgi:hypothetical protein
MVRVAKLNLMRPFFYGSVEPYSPFRGREVPTDRIMVAKASLEIGNDDYRGDKWACSAAINTSNAYHGLGR